VNVRAPSFADLLMERPDVRLPTGVIPVGQSPAVVVGVPMSRASDVVEVLLRRGNMPMRLPALPDPSSAMDGVRWFRAMLPALDPGAREEYRVEWTRAGRRIAMLPADGSWYSLVGVPNDDARSAPCPAPDDNAWASQPRFSRDLEFFAALTVNLRAEILGATPEGYRINFYVKDGRVIGPRINAVVEPGGGDWMSIRPDGIGAVNIKITYRTSDGALILEQAGGVFDTGSDGYARVAAGVLTGAPPFFATPTWSTSSPAWSWLNRCQGFGIGRVVMDKLQVQCDIYLPRVGERIGGG
jgi:hypothetical protein